MKRALQRESENILLSISCDSLKKHDVISEADPVTIVSLWDTETGAWIEIGRTEIATNNAHPIFATKVVAKYTFEEHQELKFSVYDSRAGKINEENLIGSAIGSLGAILASKNYWRELRPAGDNKRTGIIRIRAEKRPTHGDLTLKFRGVNLINMDWFTKSDPYLEIHKLVGCENILVHRTEVIKNSLNPSWKEFTVSLDDVCNGNLNLPLIIKCYDYDSSHKSDFIGEVKTTVQGMVDNNNGRWSFKHPFKRDYTGDFLVDEAKISLSYRLLDFVEAGMRLDCALLIDFGSPNGPKSFPHSLHYIDVDGDAKPNEYVTALEALGLILLQYDTDQKIPVFGCGARIDGQLEQVFNVNGAEDPTCTGVDGALTAYNDFVRNCEQAAEVELVPGIRKLKELARRRTDGSAYLVGVILTAGYASDLQELAKELTDAATLPLSIIVVGVGKKNFDDFKTLEQDVGSFAQGVHRDVLQFVPFRKYQNNSWQFAKEVLAEMPEQIVRYMREHGVAPGSWRR